MRRNEPTRIFPRPYFNPQIAEHNSPATRAPRPSAAPHPSCTTLRNCGFLIFNPPDAIYCSTRKKVIYYIETIWVKWIWFFLIFWMVIFTRNSLLFFLVCTYYILNTVFVFAFSFLLWLKTHINHHLKKKKHGFTSCSRYNCMYNNSSLDKYVQVHCIIVHFLYSIK